jgi:N-formylglutamate amidohydrolase
VINPRPSEQFPPRPDFEAEARASRRARARLIRWVVLLAFVAVGIALVLAHRYTSGFVVLGWGIVRMAMLSFRALRGRRAAEGSPGPHGP